MCTPKNIGVNTIHLYYTRFSQKRKIDDGGVRYTLVKNIVPDLGVVFRIKINRKSSAGVLIATFNSPAILVAESFGDGETEAGTFLRFVGLIETIEDFFEILNFYLGAVV